MGLDPLSYSVQEPESYKDEHWAEEEESQSLLKVNESSFYLSSASCRIKPVGVNDPLSCINHPLNSTECDGNTNCSCTFVSI